MFYKTLDSTIGKIGIGFNSTHILKIDFFNDIYSLDASCRIDSKSLEIFTEAKLQIQQYLLGQRKILTLPYSLNNLSDFSKTTLLNLQKIPYGEVSSYKNLASIHKAYQATGTALAKNCLPILFPCHRIIPHKNLLKNYSLQTIGNFCGSDKRELIEIKLFLLNLEKNNKS